MKSSRDRKRGAGGTERRPTATATSQRAEMDYILLLFECQCGTLLLNEWSFVYDVFKYVKSSAFRRHARTHTTLRSWLDRTETGSEPTVFGCDTAQPDSTGRHDIRSAQPTSELTTVHPLTHIRGLTPRAYSQCTPGSASYTSICVHLPDTHCPARTRTRTRG